MIQFYHEKQLFFNPTGIKSVYSELILENKLKVLPPKKIVFNKNFIDFIKNINSAIYSFQKIPKENRKQNIEDTFLRNKSTNSFFPFLNKFQKTNFNYYFLDKDYNYLHYYLENLSLSTYNINDDFFQNSLLIGNNQKFSYLIVPPTSIPGYSRLFSLYDFYLKHYQYKTESIFDIDFFLRYLILVNYVYKITTTTEPLYLERTFNKMSFPNIISNIRKIHNLDEQLALKNSFVITEEEYKKINLYQQLLNKTPSSDYKSEPYLLMYNYLNKQIVKNRVTSINFYDEIYRNNKEQFPHLFKYYEKANGRYLIEKRLDLFKIDNDFLKIIFKQNPIISSNSYNLFLPKIQE